jgi:hypothetical protein
LTTSVATTASPAHENVSPMMKSAPASIAQPTYSSNHRPDGVARRLAGPHVRVADVAGEQHAALARDLAGELERLPVDPLEQVLLADDPAASRGARSR